MMASLQKLAALDGSTQVYCTHEYTLHNINFALSLEPDNAALIQRRLDTLALRNKQLPSLPSTIAMELATNPFLRCDAMQIQAAVHLENQPEIEVFTQVRNKRNSY